MSSKPQAFVGSEFKESEEKLQDYYVHVENDSTTPWVFVVYQEPPDDTVSLAWFASEFRIAPGNKIRFNWKIDYQFMWASTGILKPGVHFEASGLKSCSPTGKNLTKFSIEDNTPRLSDPIHGDESGNLTVVGGPNIPNEKFSIGVAMSENGVFAVNALPNVNTSFTPTLRYWIGAEFEMHVGDVMDIKKATQSAELIYPPNVYDLKATLKEDNTWKIEPL